MNIKYNKFEYHLGFSCFSKIGPKNLKKLEYYFPDIAEAFQAKKIDLLQAGLPIKLINEFIAWRPSFDLENTLNNLEKENIKFVTWHDKAYPNILREISAPPAILYFKGLLCEKEKKRLAVIGSRKHSPYARQIIGRLLPKIINKNIEIVSGLALGVDSLAHQIAVNQGRSTLAVLGSGLETKYIYPATNRQLAKNIIESGGVLMSEFFPNTPPYKQNFPRRNRIISGLSQAVLVIEAQAQSGSLITANYALEQNREVLAVPGSIFSKFSIGTNQLIAMGAKTITNSEDILEIFETNNIALTTRQINDNKAKQFQLIK